MELLEDRAGSVEFSPLDFRPSSATVKWFKPGSSTALSSGSAVLSGGSATATTIQSVVDQTTITLTSSGFTGLGTAKTGTYLWFASSEGDWAARARISHWTVAGSTHTVYLESRLPGDLVAGDTVAPMTLTYAVSASDTADRGSNYKAEWTITDSDGTVHVHRQLHDVVRTQFYPAISSEQVARYVSNQFPGFATTMDPGQYVELSERASDRVKMRIKAAGATPHLIGDPGIFQMDCGLLSLRIDLARMGLVPAGFIYQDYIDDLERALSRAIGDVLRALAWYDSDDDNVVDAPEVKTTYTVRAVRE